MAAEDILKIVGSFDLATATDNDWTQFREETNRWRRQADNLPGPVTLWYDVAKLFISKVCIPNLPASGTPASNIAKQTMEIILDQTKDGGYEDVEYENLYGLFYDMLLQFIQLGPGSGHCIVWIALFCTDKFKEYYTALPKDKLSKMLQSIQKEFYYQGESDVNYGDYGAKLQQALRYIVEIAVNERMLKSNHDDYTNIFMCYQLNFLKSEKPVMDNMRTLSMKVWYKYDRKPFKGIRDLEMYRENLSKISTILLDDELQDEKVLKELSSTLKYIIDGITEEDLFGELYLDLMDFVTTQCTKTSGPSPVLFLEVVGGFWYHMKEETVKNKTAIFDGMTPKLIELLTNLRDTSLCDIRLMRPAVNNILIPAMNNSKEHLALWIKLIKALLPIQGCAEAAYNAVREQEKFLKWKNHVQEAKEIFLIFPKIKITYEDERKSKDTRDKYENCLQYLLEQLKKAKLISEIFEELSDYALTIVEEKNAFLYKLAERAAGYFDGLVFKKHREIIMKTLQRVTKILNEPAPEFNIKRCCILQELVCNSYDCISDFKSLKPEDLDVMVDLCGASMSGDFIDPDSNQPGTEYYRIYIVAAFKTFKLLCDGGEISRAKHIVEKVVNLIGHDEDQVVEMGVLQIYMVSNGKGGPECLEPHLPTIIDYYMEQESSNLMGVICQVYPLNGKCVEEHFQKLFESLESGDASTKSYGLAFITKVAQHQPELFTKENVDTVMEAMFDGLPVQQSMYLIIIDALAQKNTKVVSHILDDLMEKEFNEYSHSYLFAIMRKIAVKSDDKTAERVVDRFMKELMAAEKFTTAVIIMNEMRAMVATHKPLINKQKPQIEKLRENASDQTTRDMATGLIDLLEGRSLETLAGDIDTQQEEIVNLDGRVTTNENNINIVTQDVNQQKEDILGIRYEVNEQGQRINVLGEVVEETVLKVEEIDQKTLSHAPYWSRDVSKLMNPIGDADWRLLSVRLGYSNDDIRAWAQQGDPCMAMLNEWYATHKTSEASYGVLTALQEMNRLDAAIIVENAMKAADQVVEDEEFEYTSPPPIFLSYQWGHQEEVKLLSQHLGMAGYDCWMDIGQMGGGDKLFEKIDSGIRAAKVIISCTTEKYAKSPNCNREVNLAVNLKKAIIPLLLEDCIWPPPGSMGPIFSEYLYIQFYQRGQEDATDDNRYWPVPKFRELLMQLSMNGIVPDESKVHEMYKNWWMPIVEEVKIDKSKTSGGGKNKKPDQTQTNDQKEDKSPDVFISYQWGKQKNIMLLYKRLTELGYHCWMDIYQMGGGDSLYDKIDRGIRGCRIVLSCVTEKYALSANCRREVSLCDALKRPIVPLLLENCAWPPKGPMSMAFTERLYIDFHSDPDVQEKWSGPKFEELRAKIRETLPDPDDQDDTQDAEPENTATKEQPKLEEPKEKSPERKTSYVKSSKPGVKSANKSSTNQTDSSASPQDNKAATNQPENKEKSSVSPQKSSSPAHTGTPEKPKPVRPTSGAGKTSKSCTLL